MNKIGEMKNFVPIPLRQIHTGAVGATKCHVIQKQVGVKGVKVGVKA